MGEEEEEDEETEDADESEYDPDEKQRKAEVVQLVKKTPKRGQLKILKRTKRKRRKKIPTNQSVLYQDIFSLWLMKGIKLEKNIQTGKQVKLVKSLERGGTLSMQTARKNIKIKQTKLKQSMIKKWKRITNNSIKQTILFHIQPFSNSCASFQNLTSLHCL